MRNPYRILGVSSLDSKDTIKSVYKQLSKIYHPDNTVTGNAEKFKEIKDAWAYINEYHTDSKVGKSALNTKGTFIHKTLFNITRRV